MPPCPKVSICVPTYNRREYLAETLASIFRQTYTDYEVVIVDDGSTDGTEAMVRSLGRGIRYHWQSNAGDAAARNTLIELAQAPLITFIDSDDLLLDDAVQRMVEASLRENDEVVVYGAYIRIDEHGQPCGQCTKKSYSGDITSHLFQNNFVHSCGSMFPKAMLERAGKFDESLPVCADVDLWLRLSLKHRFVALPEPTFFRRRHSSNLSTTSVTNALTQLQVLERFYHAYGGSKVVPPRAARKRFSNEQRRIGRCALREGDFALASDFFRRSLAQRFNLKALFGMLHTRFRR